MSSTTELFVAALKATDITGSGKDRHHRIGLDLYLAIETGDALVNIVWWRDEQVRSIRVPVGDIDPALQRIVSGVDFPGMVIR